MNDDSKTISIRVNGDDMSITPGTTITQLLTQLEMKSKAIAVEVNHELQPRDRHDSFVLSDADFLEIVTLAGGG